MIGYGNKFGLNGLYRLFEPHFHERCEFPDHCNKRIKHIRIFKLYLTRELSESFWGKNVPVKGFVWGFCGKRFGARLKYFKNLHNLMNLVVKSDLRSGGCRKNIILYFSAGFPSTRDLFLEIAYFFTIELSISILIVAEGLYSIK